MSWHLTQRRAHGTAERRLNRFIAIHTGSKRIVLNPLRCRSYLALQSGIEIHGPDCQISFVRILDLIHRVRAFLNCHSLTASYCLKELRFFTFHYVSGSSGNYLNPWLPISYRSHFAFVIRSRILARGLPTEARCNKGSTGSARIQFESPL